MASSEPPAGAIASTSQPDGAPITSARASSRDASASSGSVGATSWSSTTRSVATTGQPSGVGVGGWRVVCTRSAMYA